MSSDHERGGKRRPLPLLTETELDVYSAIADLIAELGYAPTYRQILSRLGWSEKSKGSLHQYIERLRRRHLVTGAGRSLKVLQYPAQNDRSERALPPADEDR